MSNLSVLKLDISSSKSLLVLGVIAHGMATLAISESAISVTFSCVFYVAIAINFTFFVFKDVFLMSARSRVCLVFQNKSWLLRTKDGKEQSFLSCGCLLANGLFVLLELNNGSVTKRLLLFRDQLSLKKAHQLQVILKN